MAGPQPDPPEAVLKAIFEFLSDTQDGIEIAAVLAERMNDMEMEQDDDMRARLALVHLRELFQGDQSAFDNLEKDDLLRNLKRFEENSFAAVDKAEHDKLRSEFKMQIALRCIRSGSKDWGDFKSTFEQLFPQRSGGRFRDAFKRLWALEKGGAPPPADHEVFRTQHPFDAFAERMDAFLDSVRAALPAPALAADIVRIKKAAQKGWMRPPEGLVPWVAGAGPGGRSPGKRPRGAPETPRAPGSARRVAPTRAASPPAEAADEDDLFEEPEPAQQPRWKGKAPASPRRPAAALAAAAAPAAAAAARGAVPAKKAVRVTEETRNELEDALDVGEEAEPEEGGEQLEDSGGGVEAPAPPPPSSSSRPAEHAAASSSSAAAPGPGPQPRRRFMDPQPNARRVFWDSDDEEAEGPSSPAKKKAKAAPAPRAAGGAGSPGKGRKRHRWENWEDQSLKEGVDRFGKGRWREIRDNYKFQDFRTPVDLKDRHKILEKKGLI
eukprot:tig00020538_g10368.t1